MGYYEEVAADNPYIHYKYDQTTGTLTNSGSLGGTATVGSAVTRNITGIPGISGGKAYSFNGTTNSYTAQSVATNNYRNGDFSIEMWVKIPSKVEQTLMYHLNSGWWFSTDSLGQPFIGGGGLTGNTHAAIAINNNSWYHLVVTTTTGSTKLYVNGTLMRTINAKITPTANITNNLYTSDPSDASGTYTMNGTMDEFAFYNSVLSQSRVTAHYNAGMGIANVVIDESTPTVAFTAPELAFVGDKNSIVDVTTPSISVTGVDFASIVEGTGSVIDVPSPSISAQTEDVTVEEHVLTNTTPSRDWWIRNNTANGGTLLDLTGTTVGAVIDFELPQEFLDAGGAGQESVNLVLDVTNNYGGFKIYQITSEYVTNAVGGFTLSAGINSPAGTGTKTIDVSSIFDPDNFYGFYIERVGTGATIFSSSGANPPRFKLGYQKMPPLFDIDLTVDTPTMVVSAYELKRDVDETVATPTVSLLTSDATFSGSVATDVDSPTATLTANDVTVDSTESPDVVIDLDNITPILATAHEATFVYNEVVDVTTPTMSSDNDDVTVETVATVDIEVDAPRIRMVAIVPTDVQGEPILPSEGEDNYFDSTWATFGGVSYGLTGNTASPVPPETALWYRMNERSGDTISDRAWVYRNAAGEIVPAPGTESGKAPVLNLHGVVIGQTNGPDGRHNFSFTGYSYIDGAGGGIGGQNNNLEFTFRTTRSTQFIMGGAGLGAGTINNPPRDPWELWMVDGVLEVRYFKTYSQNGLPVNRVVETTKMRTRLDDGAWHHVVIQRAAASVDERSIAVSDKYFAFESYVDGRLETRRRIGNIPFAFPQFIGGRPNQYYRAGGWTVEGATLSPEQWFKGDMTELVYRYDDNLTEDEVTLQRDNVMNIDAYRAETARVTFKNSDVEVRGNKPRVLILDFGGYKPRTINGPGTAPESRVVNFPVSQSGKNMADQMEYVPKDERLQYVPADFPGYGEVHTPFYSSNQTGMTQWFRFDVRQKMDANGNVTNETYRDEVTDNYRLIDLEKDINMDDYDMISIIGFPQNETMFARFADMDEKNLAPFVPAKKQIEDLMEQVKDQVINHRKSLYITDPFSAIELGIIDKAEGVPWYKEHFVVDTRIGANSGGIDWHSFITDPFGTAVGDGNVIPRPLWGFDPRDPRRFSTNRRLAGTYEDTHINVRQRVRNIVQGLTTNYGWVKTDDIVWWNVNPMANPPFHRSIRYEDKRGPGLSIGDQFYMAGDHIYDSGLAGAGVLERKAGFVAAPMSAIKVGRAVTSFGATVAATGAHLEVDLEPEEMLDGTIFDMPIGNVYGDHAISIVVEPGDVWDGQFVFGKVYVNFTEFNVWNPEFLDASQIMKFATRFPDARPDEVISLGETIKTGYDREFVVTTDMLRYQWSTHYGAYQGSQIPLPEAGRTSDWGWSSGGVRNSGGFSSYGAGEAMRWGWTPTTKPEIIETPTMYQKGFRWLLDDLDVGGVVNASVETAKVNVGANDVTVDTVQNCVVDVPTTRITIESYNDADTISPNVSVLVGTPEINVKVIGLTEYIDVDTPTITLEVPTLGAGSATADWNEVLVFTLPKQYITLTMEEG